MPSEGGSNTAFASIIETETYRQVRLAVTDRISPLLVSGQGGMGKTTLLRLLERDWSAQGGRVCFVQLATIHQEGDLFRAFYEKLGHNESMPAGVEPLVVSSSADDLAQSVVALVGSADPPPLILLDGLDETLNVHPVLRIVRLLSDRTRAIVVVTSRKPTATELENLPFHHVTIPPLTVADVQKLLAARGVNQDAFRGVRQLYEIAGGNPLVAALLADVLAKYPLESLEGLLPSGAHGLQFYVRRVLDRDLARFLGEDKRALLLRTLALLAVRGSATISDLQINDEVAEALFSSSLVHRRGDVFSFFHMAIASEVLALAGALPPAGTRLQDLEFGSEEAERDSLLAKSFIDPPGVEDLRAGRKSIVVGDRGAGKSALFAALTHEPLQQNSDVQVFSLEDPAELMLRLESNGDILATAEQFRAAWLLSLACSLATQLELKSSRQKRMAARLRAAIPGGTPDTSATGRLISIWRRIRRTSVKFQLGPIVLEPAKASDVSGRGGRAIDITAFLQETATGLRDCGKQVVVAVDRIDEVHKYHRELQEKLVQGLFLAEGSLGRTPEIHLLIFIRTDLFQIYDIQEKNKLVSRTMRLHWSRDDLLRLIVHRIFSNRSLAGLAELLKDRMNEHFGDALHALFPAEIEGAPFTEWLWRCLENGNGDVSPRQLILLLLLARGAPNAYSYSGEELPVFREEVLRWAMTQLSELSFNEIINDFRVGRTLLRNCRAGKVESFRLVDVERLFDAAEGATGLQVELLERLGVLERVVVREADGNQVAKFRIPPLFTRCWTIPNVC